MGRVERELVMDKPIIEHKGTYKGYTFVVLFQPLGFRTGYVLVPQFHKYFEVDYCNINIKCHGGLTYGSHYFLEEEYPGWWIGYDCAHGDDKNDVEAQEKYFGSIKQDSFFDMLNIMTGNYDRGYGTVKTLDFCIEQCKNIIDQLREVE